jgi:hypothetical protein
MPGGPHKIVFVRSTVHDWLWKAKCSCAWEATGTRKEIVSSGKQHAAGKEWKDWVEADPTQPDAPCGEGEV